MQNLLSIEYGSGYHHATFQGHFRSHDAPVLVRNDFGGGEGRVGTVYLGLVTSGCLRFGMLKPYSAKCVEIRVPNII